MKLKFTKSQSCLMKLKSLCVQQFHYDTENPAGQFSACNPVTCFIFTYLTSEDQHLVASVQVSPVIMMKSLEADTTTAGISEFKGSLWSF